VIVDRQDFDADVGRCGAAGSLTQWAASTNTYSDALCLAIHAISADLYLREARLAVWPRLCVIGTYELRGMQAN
jgi:hypothetical protein